MKTEMQRIENLIAEARLIDESDWSSERQVNAENQVYDYLAKILAPEQLAAFENYASKATVDERLDAALYVVNGDVNWLTNWE